MWEEKKKHQPKLWAKKNLFYINESKIWRHSQLKNLLFPKEKPQGLLQEGKWSEVILRKE